MNDFLQFFAQLLDKIPATFWGVVVGSFFTLLGSFFTNRANDRRLRLQLQNDRELKNREREMTFRKDTYAAAAEAIIAELEQRKINFESLTEKIETRSPAGRLVFHVFAALAESERNLIQERTVAGLKSARARGRKGGRPAKLSSKEIKTMRALLKTADVPVAEIAARFGIARSTLYRAVLKPAA